MKLAKPSKIHVHSSDEYSGVDYREYYTWNFNHKMDIRVSMTQTYTTENARKLTIRFFLIKFKTYINK